MAAPVAHVARQACSTMSCRAGWRTVREESSRACSSRAVERCGPAAGAELSAGGDSLESNGGFQGPGGNIDSYAIEVALARTRIYGWTVPGIQKSRMNRQTSAVSDQLSRSFTRI